jgi:hypothetical protein
VPQCQAVLKAPCVPTVAFDQQGLVFAVGLDKGSIKLYDASNYDQGPFENFVVGVAGGQGTGKMVWGGKGGGALRQLDWCMLCLPGPSMHLPPWL